MDSCDSLEQKLDKLPKQLFWDFIDLYQWDGFWYTSDAIKGMLAFQSHYEARPDDIILTSCMKTGTTWLKALCLCILENQKSDENNENEDVLVKDVPHALVRNIENDVYKDNSCPDLSLMPSPRIFHTHLPYSVLPDSIIKNPDCKLVYIVRNPGDTLVSTWHFFNKFERPNTEQFPFEKAFEDFCNGVHLYGPFYDHVLEYWFESLKRPQKILFLKYEELKRDPKEQVKKLASFLGRPFGNEEEVDKVLWRCSLERLKNLEVNKHGGSLFQTIPNSAFFRLGVTGDWTNYLTPEMKQHLDHITRTRLEGSGLDFEYETP